jgi:hypothetical protein
MDIIYLNFPQVYEYRKYVESRIYLNFEWRRNELRHELKITHPHSQSG